MTLYIISLIACATIFIVGVSFAVVTAIDHDVFGTATTTFDLIDLVVTVIFSFGTVFSLIAMLNQKEFIEQLKLENSYVLGHPITFYNLAAFKNRANKLNRFVTYSKYKRHIIAFTVASLDISSNQFQNEDVKELNYQVALAVSDLFESNKSNLSNKFNIYAFSRGVFLIYNYHKDESAVREIVTSITNEIYRIVKEQNLKIWAQPFFGVREIEEDDNFASAIEDAMIARSQGEANFSSFTKFIKKTEDKTSGVIEVNEIKKALENQEFVPYYQPKFSVREKKFVGSEVLVRWNSPTRGLLTPGSFIDKAEQFGLISSIDIYVFEKALIDISDSIRRGRRVIPISCNFSLYEFFSHTFIDTITGLLQKYQVPPSLVEVEITETTSQVNQFLSVSVIKKLKEYGIRVLMDDYGVGFSQIQNLKAIPFDAIKIDKSFADLMLEDQKTNSIVKFLIELGHTNDMEVIIEGVEKKEQLEILKKYHIDTIQGFYYSKALPYKEYQEFLKNNPFEAGGNK